MPDASQRAAAAQLDQHAAAVHAAAASRSRPLRPWAYLWGDVGSGKTMLLDLAHAEWRERGSARAGDERGVLRAHFHDFLLDAHQRLHALHSHFL